jgi:hypothetical protein
MPSMARAAPEGMTALDELEIIVVIDDETDTLSSVDEGVLQVPEVRPRRCSPRGEGDGGAYRGHRSRSGIARQAAAGCPGALYRLAGQDGPCERARSGPLCTKRGRILYISSDGAEPCDVGPRGTTERQCVVTGGSAQAVTFTDEG